MFIVGIDIAKRSHEAIIIAEDGQVVRKAFSFRNNCTGYNLLLEQVRRLTLVKSQIVFAMESTAHYWLALYARLLKDGYAVMVLNPIQSHSLRELYIRKAKTDARDSLIIADLVRFGRCKASNVPQDKILALRELCRSRAYLVDMAADLKRKLIALLDRIFPEYESLFDSIFSKASIAVLSKYSTPQKVKNANLRKLTDILMESSNGHFGEWKAHQLKEAACSSFGIDDSGGVYSTLLGMFIEQILSLTAQADSLEKQITELHHFHPARKGSGSLCPFPIYPLYTRAVILSLDKPIADCFLFRPRKRLEKRKKRSHTNVSNTLVIRTSIPPAQTAHACFLG